MNQFLQNIHQRLLNTRQLLLQDLKLKLRVVLVIHVLKHKERKCWQIRKERKERLKQQAEVIEGMRNEMKRIQSDLEALRNENENLKKRNKVIQDLQDKTENERHQLQVENDNLEKNRQKIKNFILKNPFFQN